MGITRATPTQTVATLGISPVKARGRQKASTASTDEKRERILKAMSKFCNDYPLDTQEMDVNVAAGAEFAELLERLNRDDLPRFEERFKQLLNENTIREIANFQSQLNRERESIRERVEQINGSLRQIDYNPGRYIVLELQRTIDAEIRDFQSELRACTEGDPLFLAVETLLKGPDISLTAHGQAPYIDKDGHPRRKSRLRWWHDGPPTLRALAEMGGRFTTADGELYPDLPDIEVSAEHQRHVYRDQVPVVYGHYWRHGSPQHLHDWTELTACVDFSAVKGGALTAYRWSGETRIRSENYVRVELSPAGERASHAGNGQ